MKIIGKDFKYKLVKNFLTEEELTLGLNYSKIYHMNNHKYFDYVQNNNCDTGSYSDFFAEALLASKIKRMEEETGLKLFPTYSYWRVYSMFAELTPHMDRKACEISVSVMFGSCGTPWPIYVDEEPIEMQPGDAVIYLGCELNHYRKPFEGDWHAQAFLHYVNQEGPNKDNIFDKRPFLGYDKR